MYSATSVTALVCDGSQILLADFGHKKIYQASARTLVSTVPIWAKQRPCNEARVDASTLDSSLNLESTLDSSLT